MSAHVPPGHALNPRRGPVTSVTIDPSQGKTLRSFLCYTDLSNMLRRSDAASDLCYAGSSYVFLFLRLLHHVSLAFLDSFVSLRRSNNRQRGAVVVSDTHCFRFLFAQTSRLDSKKERGPPRSTAWSSRCQSVTVGKRRIDVTNTVDQHRGESACVGEATATANVAVEML